MDIPYLSICQPLNLFTRVDRSRGFLLRVVVGGAHNVLLFCIFSWSLFVLANVCLLRYVTIILGWCRTCTMCIFTTDTLLSKIHFLGLMKCSCHLCVPYILVEPLSPPGLYWLSSFASDFQWCCLTDQGSPSVILHIVSFGSSSLLFTGI